jgi:cytoskeletal protein RodZ
MDHMNKTIVPTSLDNTRGSNYGHWSILIILVIFLGVFIIWGVYTYGFSTFQQNTNVTPPTTNPTPSDSPTELYKTSSNISDNNMIVNDNDNDINNAMMNI